ncbi:ATPase, T2SS/T4P/T4SS family [Ruegeria sp. 2205SS24-7]|uniref:ATPase, T2SS/T4P/T4SS family n=1 Tax=Ruegeria discodermiae TaxID=3064389 RepID=UPI0027421A31|nr:ATPase, T2SS/T4P/T4SS family [Ruegeria sp. 2205SS24-7]MDP5218815.1 ATPase, T2SS/T4P/T4SS family [Ruegeria sp. 2205SS24-7]
MNKAFDTDSPELKQDIPRLDPLEPKSPVATLPASYLEQYLEPFRDLIECADIVELAINPDGQVWIERQGASTMEQTGQNIAGPAAANLAATLVGDARAKMSEKSPLVSGKIEYRDRPLRIQVVVPPAVERGAAISIRLFGMGEQTTYEPEYLFGEPVSLDDKRQSKLAEIQDLAKTNLSGALEILVQNRLNLLISGGTSTGKTTFARHLLKSVHDNERLITIEDAFELFPNQPNSVCLLAERTPNTTRSANALLQAGLRMRPDRIVVGELRGPEALTYLEAINTGHGGSVTTIHAETAGRAVDRLALMVLQAGTPLTFGEVQTYIRKSIDIIVQLGRVEGRRGIAEVLVV